MNSARILIDRLVEAQEQATVKVELSGTPQAIQRGLKYLAKSKNLKKAAEKSAREPAKSVAKPSVPKSDDDDGEDDKD